MPRMPDLSNEQSAFLRAFRRSPTGPPPKQWPTPRVLRRWMTKPAFRRAVDEIRAAMEFQSHMHLAAASVGASYALIEQSRRCHAPADGAGALDVTPRRDMKRGLDLLRLLERREARR